MSIRVAALLTASLSLPVASADFDRPQYICVNKAYGVSDGWVVDDPRSFTQASIDEILTVFGGQRGSTQRKLCVSFNFWTLFDADAPTMLASLDALLSLVQANDLPLSISLDPTQWWEARPDLWNWYDRHADGYDPLNVANVEWFGPSPDNATLISWRNWGSQFRVGTPHPNFASAAFREAAAASVSPLAARLAAWYRTLPTGKKWLLASVRATQELWIGTNYYYYDGGNALAGQSPKRDPTGGPGGRAVQLGYAAVCGSGSGGAGCSGSVGSALTPSQLDAVVSSFAGFAAQVLLDAGLPRSRVFVHTGTYFGGAPVCASNCVFNSPQAALVSAASPAWSPYGGETLAANAVGLSEALTELSGAAWGAAEWLPFFDGGHAQADWAAALDGTLGFLNNRLVVIQNFESISDDANATAAVVAALNSGLGCVVDAPTGLAAKVNASELTLHWQPPPSVAVSSLALLVSTLALTLPSGVLAMANVASTSLDAGKAAYTLTLPPGLAPGEVYVQVITLSMQGCGGPGQSFTQSAPSDVLVVPLVA